MPYGYARAVHPEAGDLKAKLDFNEAGYSPSPLVKKAVLDFVANEPINWYPDVTCRDLKAALSDYVGFASSHLSVFNGCDHALECLCHAYLDEGDRVAIFAPTYDNFRVFVEMAGGKVDYVFADNPFMKNIDGLDAALSSRTKIVYLSNPTNPTGITYSPDEVARILEKAFLSLVIVDEAYFEFWGQSSVSLVRDYPNLAVTRSFSKAYALAGLRCGYLISSPENILSVDKVRNAKHINALAQAAASAALHDQSYYSDRIREMHRIKKDVIESIRRLDIPVVDTPANYILIRVINPDAVEEDLAAKKILVRNRSSLPQMAGFLRITIGSQAEMAMLVEALGQVSPQLLKGRIDFDAYGQVFS